MTGKLTLASDSPNLSFEQKEYLLKELNLIRGENLDKLQLCIVSYIGEVRSEVPVTFSKTPGFHYLNEGKTRAKIAVRLNFFDKANIQLFIRATTVEDYELEIFYDIVR